MLAPVADTLAAPVSSNMAGQVATQWVQQNVVFQAAGIQFRVQSVTPIKFAKLSTAAAFHVALSPHGYVIVGGDDRLPPVMAFGTTGALNLDDVPQNALRGLLGRNLSGWHRATQSGANVEADRDAMAQHRGEWRLLVGSETLLAAAEEPGESLGASSTLLVAPMLQTQWSQWNHFNENYPVDPQPGSGYDGRAPAGCMPVAGAQLARFYAWPTYGATGHTDNDANPANLIAGNFYAPFGNTINWAAMQNQYNPWGSEPSSAVAPVSDVLYRLGVALNLDFGSFNLGGSSASLQSLGRALNRCFFFERGTYMARAGSVAAFDVALRNEVLAGRPVVCAIPGHAVVVDGLSVDDGVDYFHMNYGFGGMNDGWYRPSAIPEGSVESAILGERPALVPLLNQHGFVTNVTGVLSPTWQVAAARQGDVTRFRICEGQYVATNSLTDYGNGLQAWTDHSGAWTLESPGFGGGSCFRKVAEVGDFSFILRDIIIPTASTRLQFNYKAILLQDHVYVEVSADRGNTWQLLRDYTNTGYDTAWRAENVDLGAFAGRELLVRVMYSFKSGTYYGATGGFWMDNISLNDFQQMRWTVAQDNIAPTATNHTVGTRLSGTYHFEVQAHNGSRWSAAAPFVTVTVVLDPALDVDSDGLSNGWESNSFGGPTNGVASLDSDGDGHSNLQEFVAGTNPNNASDRLAVRGASTADSTFNVSWSAVSGKTYTVWRAPALTGGYTPLASNIVATPPLNTYIDATAPTACFYRISVQ